MSLKKTLIGAGLGFAAGCVFGVSRTAVTVTCPWLWIPGGAASAGLVAWHVSEGNVPATVVATIAGGCVGVAELAAYPVTAPLALAQNACLPALGAIAGAAIGYKS